MTNGTNSIFKQTVAKSKRSVTAKQISPSLMGILHEKYPIEGCINTLLAYSKIIDAIESLGWLEHTGDWDPYLQIELKNGITFETESGYTEIYFFEDDETGKLYDEVSFEYTEEFKREFPLIDRINVNDIVSIRVIV